jgi:uncharacterized protein (DUF58 family)
MLGAFVRSQGRAWALRRQGIDRDLVHLTSRRIYILPTGQGVAFGAMIFLMLLGAMNYNNSVGLAVTFALTAFALVVMHHCHRTLSGLRIALGAARPVFAGQPAQFAIELNNPSSFARLDIGVFVARRLADCVCVAPGESRKVTIAVPTDRRGRLALERISLRSRYPAGLFQAWAWLNTDLSCLVYPEPAVSVAPPPQQVSVDGSRLDATQGDNDFAGLRDYQTGDSSRRIAWKTFARNHVLAVKTFSGADVAPIFLNWSDTHGETEHRLAVLTRWCLDAQNENRSFGLNLNHETIAPGDGRAHLHRCLRALALHP